MQNLEECVVIDLYQRIWMAMEGTQKYRLQAGIYILFCLYITVPKTSQQVWALSRLFLNGIINIDNNVFQQEIRVIIQFNTFVFSTSLKGCEN